MLTACLIILAWTANLPLWASVLITVFASVRFVWKLVIWIIRLCKNAEEHNGKNNNT